MSELSPSLTSRPVLIFDFGSQYVQLIARRVREHRAYARIVRHDLPVDDVIQQQALALILSGGPASVYESDAPRCDPAIFDLDLPILSICYGMQLMCGQISGWDAIQAAPSREYGNALCQVLNSEDSIFAGLPETLPVWMSHADQVTELGPEFKAIASTHTCPLAAVRHTTRPVFGLQFHPEVAHTLHGDQILANFLNRVAGNPGHWNLEAVRQQSIAGIQEKVGRQDRVICGLSGGVDSSVTAALVAEAIGSRLTCVFVDNGLLRLGERDQVVQTFGENSQAELRVIDASDRFLAALEGVEDPQEKRVRIGHTFIEVFREQALLIPDAKFLAQGTLYPDVIESGGAPDGPTATIKHHHNVGGLPEDLGFELIEPLRDLFKDEVRRLGLDLGLAERLVNRHPFPGPGLAIRCLGEVTQTRLDRLRAADAIVLEELLAAGWMETTGQAFAVLLNVQSVGVMGDGRTYENPVAIRCVDSSDFMTADWTRLPFEILARMSTRITNEVPGVNRVVYDISSKPPATIEWE